MSQEDCNKVKEAVDTLARAVVPPRTSERAEDVLSDALGALSEDAAGEATTESEESPSPQAPKPRKPGHGRNGASAYSGATKVEVKHPELKAGDPCPCAECHKGKVYPLGNPSPRVRVVGVVPFQATVHNLEQYRCNACGEVYTAPEPEEIGPAKYDETVASMLALLRYGSGMPFNRIEQLQLQMGIPLPASVQWGLVEAAAALIKPVFQEMARQAAQMRNQHNDDSSMKVLKLERPEGDKRTGTHTTGIVAHDDNGRHIAIFITGRQHAGENLGDLLRHRAPELGPAIQMCDALNRNSPKSLPEGVGILLAHCIIHARRNFVDIIDNFPNECRYVIEALGKVYHHDEMAREQKMSPDERLRHHKELSGPVMKALKAWLQGQLEDKLVEPNSSLGKAMKYFLTHWDPLTLFLRVAGAQLDNNVAERALKKVVLHRKNSLFYLTLNGAQVGDLFMSLIHTCKLNGVDPFKYLVALQKHPEELSAMPSAWMPWNYELAVAHAAPD